MSHDPVRWLRPGKGTALELLVNQDQTSLVPDQALQLIASLRVEQIHRAILGIVAQHILHDEREPRVTFAVMQCSA